MGCAVLSLGDCFSRISGQRNGHILGRLLALLYPRRLGHWVRMKRRESLTQQQDVTLQKTRSFSSIYFTFLDFSTTENETCICLETSGTKFPLEHVIPQTDWYPHRCENRKACRI